MLTSPVTRELLTNPVTTEVLTNPVTQGAAHKPSGLLLAVGVLHRGRWMRMNTGAVQTQPRRHCCWLEMPDKKTKRRCR